MNKKDGILGMISGIIFIIMGVIVIFILETKFQGISIIFGFMGVLLLFAGAIVYDISVGREKEKKELKNEVSKDRYCPGCGRAIPFDALLCPYCGKKF